MSILRWGLLGTARINRRLIPAIRAAARSELVAVASRDLARAEAHAREWSIPRAVAGYEHLLRADDIDAIYIPLPNSMHAAWTLAAIAAGKHVLCEKPLALETQDVDRIRSAAAAHGVVVEEGLMYRHEPLTARVASLVESGAVGTLRAIVSGFTFAQNRTDDVRLDPSLGGGALWDVGCYPVTYARLLAGRDPATALGAACLLPTGVDGEFTGVLSFPGGSTATIYSGFRAVYRTWLDILGSEGVLRVPNPFKPGPFETVELERPGHIERIKVEGSPTLFVRQVEDFEAAVLDGVPTVVSLAESRSGVAALAALYASSRQGVAVDVNSTEARQRGTRRTPPPHEAVPDGSDPRNTW